MDKAVEDNDGVLLWTIEDTANALSVHPKTITRLVQSGDLPVVRIGRSIRIEKQVVCHFIEDRRAYNDDCAGLAMRDPQGERKWLKSAKSEKVSSDARVQSTGGPLSPTQAVKEFNDLLGRPARAKH
ncbi:MAG: helix-turn-helix domain-containing protein [Acidiferrobacteraceae bacterium]|nr:helix-turn-helix domain-containing protein [Acidiferrobacteraceae bacterium]